MRRNLPDDDVSAVVLTIGEATAERAIESLREQSLPLRETIVIRDLRPFHRAMNAGAARVTTPFFAQVDADMILDRNCIATMRGAVRDDTGFVVAHLRDRLIGECVGIKLYRTSCFKASGLPDSISPDVDLGLQIVRAGWKRVELGLSKINRWKWPTTLGAHEPNYSPVYTFAKHLMLGRRFRYNRDLGGVLLYFERLESSAHPVALLAEVALANGIFLEEERDILGIINPQKETKAVADFLENRGNGPTPRLRLRAPGEEVFDAGYRLGNAMFQSGSAGSFKGMIEALNPTRWDARAWIAKVGLYRGLLAGSIDAARIHSDFSTLRKFLADADRGARIRQNLQGWMLSARRIFSAS